MPRYFDRTRAIEKKRREVEAATLAILLLGLQGLWRLIFPRWRDGRQDEIESAFNSWVDDWDADYEAAMTNTAGEFSVLESSWWQSAGKQVVIDPTQIAADYVTDFHSQWGKPPAEALRDSIRRDVRYDLEQARMAHLQDVTLGRGRAEGIAADLATDVLGQVVMTGLRLSGSGWWVWQTAEDADVCVELCEPLHGSVFPVTVAFVKKHRYCRCQPTPLGDWLRVRDQPFQGIAEGLAVRANE